jgi:MHS family proline/betaine transporter-like MFS transporter
MARPRPPKTVPLRGPVRATLDTFGLSILWTVAYYVFLVYMPTFTRLHAKLDASQALWANTVGLLGVVIASQSLDGFPIASGGDRFC